MKPLKRPMFRSGGPIKEGIMDGMKQPQQLVQPNEDGSRPGYAGPLAAIPLILQGLRAGRMLAPIARNASFFQRINPMRLMSSGRFRDTTKFVKDADKAIPAKPGGPQFIPVKSQTTRGGLFESLKDPKKLGMAIRENPFTAASLLTVPNLAATAAIKAGPSIFEGAKEAGKMYIDAVLPGKQFRDDKDPKTTEKDTEGLKRVDSFDETETKDTAVVPGGGDGTENKQNLTADRIEENRKRYYKLMGIDKMKRGAAYDSLIDASRIIQEEGGDLKGAIKSGSLQSQIINAISKNLDSSRDLKRQIDAAILKGEIEKDIKASDPTAQVAAELKKSELELRKKQLEGFNAQAEITKLEGDKGFISSEQTASILRKNKIPYDEKLSDEKFEKFERKNPGKDEIDYIIEELGPSLDDGRYVLGGRLIEKRGSNVSFVDIS
jgi:hypothetical protein|tara:strand:+ start:41 stop:1348 length:1308 start_codon:yes stop_codon:yes gene_type:complete